MHHHGYGVRWGSIWSIGMMYYLAKRREKMRRKHLERRHREQLLARVARKARPVRSAPQQSPVVILAPTRVFEPPQARDLHAGYHYTRGGPPPEASPARGYLRTSRDVYTPPGRPALSPVTTARTTTTPAPAPTPAATPAPAPHGYQGDLDELLLALTSNGFKKPVAIAKIKAAGLTPDDTLTSALLKCFRATAQATA